MTPQAAYAKREKQSSTCRKLYPRGLSQLLKACQEGLLSDAENIGFAHNRFSGMERKLPLSHQETGQTPDNIRLKKCDWDAKDRAQSSV